jgi:hypothetical protein
MQSSDKQFIGKQHFHIKITDTKIQIFLAILAFVEKYQKKYTFSFEGNKSIQDRVIELYPEIKLSKINEKIITVEIDHKTPNTRIGNFNKPLIFPKTILNFQKKYKKNKILFIGLITKKRFIYILKSIYKIDKLQFLHLFKLIFTNTIETNTFVIINSSKGRDQNFKYWDENYYNLMSTYSYTLCPPGDYEWTYRYYESILLKCIPFGIGHNSKAYPYGIVTLDDYKYNISLNNNDQLENYISYKDAIKSLFI